MMRLVPPVPPSVPETGSAVTVCVEITSGTLSPGQTATVNLATGDGTAQGKEAELCSTTAIYLNVSTGA